MTIICRCLNKCFGICRRSRRDPLLPITEPKEAKVVQTAEVVRPEHPAGPPPPPPKDSEIVRIPRLVRSSKPTRTARGVRVSERGGVARPGQAPKLKLSPTAKVKLGEAAKAKPVQAPRPKPGQAQKADGDSEGNISDEEYPPLPPSREGSHTGITPEISDIDINETRDIDDIDDIDISDAEPGDELFFSPPAEISVTPAPQSEQASERATRSRKRGHIEDIAKEGQEGSSATTYEDTPSPAKRARTDEADVQTPAQVPAGRQLTPPTLHPSTPPPPQKPSSSSSGFDDTNNAMWPEPTEEQLAIYRQKGARLIAWLEDPNEPGCNIAQATITTDDLLNNLPEAYRYQVRGTYFLTVNDILEGGDPESMGITTNGNRYRFTYLLSHVNDPEVLAGYGREKMDNKLEQIIGPGIIVASSIFRHDSIQWNEIARALYVMDHPITTLRHIMYETVINEETAPYIRRIAYPRYNLSFEHADREPCLIIERGTQEYVELLGTKLGKTTAIFLISSLPRGTIRIARAYIWNIRQKLQLVFQFELIPDSPYGQPENPADRPETAECD
ncbi:hypothetical protein PCG10_009798 [Penicillium crustosum]|uniref:Uncharacterized protein n=1 Tax=Penicillium crustosum TaxID=36656 RepID=A0A9P5KWE3_PENCR|nr:uncharacterized protein N7487_002368 [Penicillium crustosum]KAF7519755.1 hypothetical protein PCG10_009798 [Penicillium crustosum]KAJ5418818.1 hypothetical protein N7487_002368 [Penicillium crustosum]